MFIILVLYLYICWGGAEYTGLFISPWTILKISNKQTTQRIMVILTLIEKNSKFFKGKARAHSCPDLLLGDSSNKHGRRPWNADTRVERDGLSHSCLPYYQRWIHCASVKYVQVKILERFSLYRRKNYHDPLRSLFVVNF
jgi:hypothetical protein